MKEHTWEDTLAEVKAWSEIVYRLAFTQDGDIRIISFSWASEYEYEGNHWVNDKYYKSEEEAETGLLITKLKHGPLTTFERIKLAKFLEAYGS